MRMQFVYTKIVPMKIHTLLFCLFIPLLSMSQEKNFSILGIVKDSATGTPMPGASVFAQNTTLGTITNADGNFFLRLPAGGYDLVISYTGYSKSVLRISNTIPLSDTVEIWLTKQDSAMDAVDFVVSSETPNGLERFGAFFMEHFIGTTPNAKQCIIENPEALHFYYSKKRNRLKITAHEDLIIKNYALGYTIRYQLDSFRYDYKTLISQYNGHALFELMDSTEAAIIQWEKNRAATYLGSRLHFMRALYNRELAEEGFIVEKMIRKPGRTATGELLADVYDDSRFRTDSSGVIITWDGRHRIGYKRVWPSKEYLKEFNFPEDTKMQVSIIDVHAPFTIEENGYFYDQADMVNAGYWAWKKLAELLPYDFEYD